ncbi:MAG TPA: archease [Dissulfurispiraceae bacterium]|nr:archease [Dissulfurispiraceae bacterium]
MQFEILDISGDVGIRAYGKTVSEAYANAGIGMYSLITDISDVEEQESVEFEMNGDSHEGVLAAYLNELIFRFDTYGFIGKRVEVPEFSGSSMRVIVYGEEFDPDRHERRLLIKAATYHNIKIERADGVWEVEVVFDI